MPSLSYASAVSLRVRSLNSTFLNNYRINFVGDESDDMLQRPAYELPRCNRRARDR